MNEQVAVDIISLRTDAVGWGLRQGVGALAVTLLVAFGVAVELSGFWKRVASMVMGLALGAALAVHFANVQTAVEFDGRNVIFRNLYRDDLVIPKQDIVRVEERFMRTQIGLVVVTKSGRKFSVNADGRERQKSAARFIAEAAGLKYAPLGDLQKWRR